MQTEDMDQKDQMILSLLKENARLTYSQIAEKVGLSRTAIKNRVSALEQSGIIKGYHAFIDPFASTGRMLFVINIETKPEHFDHAKAYFEQAEETITLIQTSGRCHLLIICTAKDLPAMRTRLNDIYRTLPGIVSINAHSILEVIKGNILPD